MRSFDFIIKQVKEHTRINSKKELAVLFELSPADFSNRVKRGTILPLIVDWAINENVNLDWLLKDKNPNSLTRSNKNFPDLANEHLLLINTYDAAEDSIKEAALIMLKNSAEKSKNAERKDSDYSKLGLGRGK